MLLDITVVKTILLQKFGISLSKRNKANEIKKTQALKLKKKKSFFPRPQETTTDV